MDNFTLDFIGIGAARSGTTWLATCLNEHPMVCVSKPKELHYFCSKTLTSLSNYDLGEKWYRSHFSRCTPNAKWGEVSVSYLGDEQATVRIKERFPDAKLFVCFRNPVEALYSHYFHTSTIYPVPDTFESFVTQNPQFIDYFRYAEHTKRYLRSFGADQIHFMLYEDITANPLRMLSELYDFLEVDPSFVPPSLNTKSNCDNHPRFTLVRNALGSTKRLLDRSSYLRKFYKKLRLEELGAEIIRLNARRCDIPPLSPLMRSQLMEIYHEDIIELGELIGRDTCKWLDKQSMRLPATHCTKPYEVTV